VNTASRPMTMILAVATACLALAGSVRADAVIFEKILPSTGVIIVPLDNKTNSQGTCWVVDQERKLVITNNHVVQGKKDAIVFFPMFNNGEVIPLREHTVKFGERITGEVIHTDVARDLALVRLEKLPATAKSMTLASRSTRPGETLHSVGNSGYNNGILWRYTRGQVRSVAPYRLTLKTGQINCMVVETQGPINNGDSGGPLVNDRGDLVGVISAFNTQDRLITWNIDVREVRSFMADADRPAPTQASGRRGE